MSEFSADVTIVGAGVAGLWSAKELVDKGHTVQVIERSETLAAGASTRNEGWLHAGTYHSVAIEREEEIGSVVTQTRWSHQQIEEFAPNAIDHNRTYALAADDEMADKAIARWRRAGVDFTEVAPRSVTDADVLDSKKIAALFEVDDKSINSRALCQALSRYVCERGVTFLTDAAFTPTGDTTADATQGDMQHTLVSSRFLITAGNAVKEIVEAVTGKELSMRFFKAHLLVTPRLTTDNYFYLEPGEVGIMNHGTTSVVGINRDGIELPQADSAVVQEKKQLIYDAMCRLVPSAVEYPVDSATIEPVACCKPDVTGVLGDTQSLDVTIFEPAPNYVCALPGKMTMAPYLAKAVVGVLQAERATGARHQLDYTDTVDVTMRPADEWMNRHNY